MKSVTATSVDEYIARFPPEIQNLLERMRETIKKAAPTASEKISYQIPTFYLNGNLVHFAAFKQHIGFYPTSSGIRHFEEELSAFECSKGTVRFSLNQPILFSLIAKIVKFRVEENS